MLTFLKKVNYVSLAEVFQRTLEENMELEQKFLKSVSPPWGHERGMIIKNFITFACKKL